MIINDETIYKRIRRYREEVKRVDQILGYLSDAKNLYVAATPYIEIRSHLTSSTSILKQHRKAIVRKVELLKNKLSVGFWVDHAYDEI